MCEVYSIYAVKAEQTGLLMLLGKAHVSIVAGKRNLSDLAHSVGQSTPTDYQKNPVQVMVHPADCQGFMSYFFPVRADRLRKGEIIGRITMSVYISDAISTCPASRSTHEKEETSLAAIINDLAVLRFSIVVTAKWEVAESEDAERRTELRTELADLRHLYFEKLDQIAMTFGVGPAMKAKEDVERKFKTSREIEPAMVPIDRGQLYF